MRNPQESRKGSFRVGFPRQRSGKEGSDLILHKPNKFARLLARQTRDQKSAHDHCIPNGHLKERERGREGAFQWGQSICPLIF